MSLKAQWVLIGDDPAFWPLANGMHQVIMMDLLSLTAALTSAWKALKDNLSIALSLTAT